MKNKKDSPEEKMAQILKLFGEHMLADRKEGDPPKTMHVELVDGKMVIADSKESFEATKDLVTETAKKRKSKKFRAGITKLDKHPYR